jgi:hypothetical protein
MRGFRIKIHYYGMKERCHICGSAEHMKNECPKKPAPVGSPITRHSSLNLNEMFKKPGPKAISDAPNTVFPSVSYAQTTAGIPLLPIQSVAQPEEQQVVVTVTNDESVENIMEVIETGLGNTINLLQVPNREGEGTGEVEWQRVQRRTRSHLISGSKCSIGLE